MTAATARVGSPSTLYTRYRCRVLAACLESLSYDHRVNKEKLEARQLGKISEWQCREIGQTVDETTAPSKDRALQLRLFQGDNRKQTWPPWQAADGS